MLAAWAASPARFREDANAEEDLVRGGYRDRVLIELAQNAADAASRAGAMGRVRFELRGDLLRVANTGAPIDAAGIESASTLRASSKRVGETRDGLGDGAAVGRFGVGFSAVLAVSDEPTIVSRDGAVAWSLARTRDDVASIAALTDEVLRRGDALPVLRLPYVDVSGRRPADGFDSEVLLPLRDAAAVALVRTLLDDVDAALLLTMPALSPVEIVVDGVTRTLTAEPTADGDLLEYLGSVDSEGQEWMEYLAHADIAQVTKAKKAPVTTEDDQK